MLVLTRKKNEIITIAGGYVHGGVDICVVEIRGDKVRIGVNAPPTIPVHRKEVQDAMAHRNLCDGKLPETATEPPARESIGDVTGEPPTA